MTDRHTTITLPTSRDPGLQVPGRVAPAELIADYRAQARRQLEQAQQVLAAADTDFRVVTHRGIHRITSLEILQPGHNAREERGAGMITIWAEYFWRCDVCGAEADEPHASQIEAEKEADEHDCTP